MGANWKPVSEILSQKARRELGVLEQLEAWLGANGTSQAGLARELGITRGALSLILQGKRTSGPVLERIAELSGIPLKKLEAAVVGEP